MSCDLTCKEVRTLSSGANGRAKRDRLHRSEDENRLLSHLRGNILQRGSLRWSRPDRQAGACHLVEAAENRTSKNEK